MDNHGETPIEKTVVLRVIDEELYVSSSEDLHPVYVAGMLYKALQAVHFMLTEVDSDSDTVVH